MDPLLRAWAASRGGVFTYAEACRRGAGEPDLRRWLRAGHVVSVRRGAYALADAWHSTSPEGRLALRTRAALATRPGSIASHQSALALHGLPLYSVPLTTVDVIGAVSRVRSRSGLRVHRWTGDAAAEADPGAGAPHVVADGYRCLPVATALAQTALRSGLLAGLVPLDHALHQSRCSADEVATALTELAGRPGQRRVAEQLLQGADPACESVGETRTRALLQALGHRPVSQVAIRDHRGTFLARVDFLVGERVVVEFDGAVKYGGRGGVAALVAEKAREDALREAGYIVIRVVWSDLDHPDDLARRLRRAVAQSSLSGAVVTAT
jgi:very-short-patch-repair endonuclease